ncbi:MAG TPA: deoxyribodipyrimidine photo-lyase [archaeon]|nr:deoxyribodipyrimidine photo-lyase [archaeon]
MNPRGTPPARITLLNDRSERSGADFVLYWIQMYHRAEQNWALTTAIEAANRLALPLVAYHGLGYTYPHASDRIHRFILEGVSELVQRLASRGIRYHFYLRQCAEDPNDVLYRLARRAALIITDDFPAFIIPEQTRRAAMKVEVPMLVVDSNGIVPLAEIPGEQYGAYTLRPKIRRLLPQHLKPVPESALKRDSLDVRLDVPETRVTLETIGPLIAASSIDHAVGPSLVYHGGYREARARLNRFIAGPLKTYGQARNQPGRESTSRLSSYLHFGQIAVEEVALAVREATSILAADRDAFLEELIVRRELAYNFCRYNPNHRSLDALPTWAKETLQKHSSDARPHRYSFKEFEAARTHDYLWNAIQAELLTTGAMFGYYRMYWGKKIIEWSRTPAEAQETMIRLHEKYALDGRNPNTYSNILWCFGKHDRPWVERPVFGTVRYMSLAGMEAKTGVRAYVDWVNRWCEEAGRPDLRVEAPVNPARTRKGGARGTR